MRAAQNLSPAHKYQQFYRHLICNGGLWGKMIANMDVINAEFKSFAYLKKSTVQGRFIISYHNFG